jgi:hypothetical protein
MKRAVVAAAVLAALAAAAPAEAKVPPVHGGSVLGRNRPLKVYASVTPPVHLFADAVTAKVAVVADRKWVAPGNLRVIVRFAPYQPVGPPTEVRTANGRLLQITWTWQLRCLAVACVPETRTSDTSRIFHFRRAHVEYLSPGGKVRYALDAGFPPIVAFSQLSPSVVAGLTAHRLYWQYQLTPLPAPHYRVAPGLAFWLAVALASLLGAMGLAVAARWALTLFFWARAQDDETLQRKALERVADELPFDVHDLSETARALAWSPESPEAKDVQEISERAGIHRRNGEPEP